MIEKASGPAPATDRAQCRPTPRSARPAAVRRWRLRSGRLAWWALMMLVILRCGGGINGLGHVVATATRDLGFPPTTPWAFLLGGEELHNNHHAFPSSARFAMRRFSSTSAGWCCALQRVGLRRSCASRPSSLRPSRAARRRDRACADHVRARCCRFFSSHKPAFRPRPLAAVALSRRLRGLLADGRWLDQATVSSLGRERADDRDRAPALPCAARALRQVVGRNEIAGYGARRRGVGIESLPLRRAAPGLRAGSARASASVGVASLHDRPARRPTFPAPGQEKSASRRVFRIGAGTRRLLDLGFFRPCRGRRDVPISILSGVVFLFLSVV